MMTAEGEGKGKGDEKGVGGNESREEVRGQKIR